MHIDKEKLGDLLKRKRANESQRTFAKRLGVSLGTYQGWENGVSIPEKVNLEKIASACGITFPELVAYLVEGIYLPVQNDVDSLLEHLKYLGEKDFARVVRAVGDRLSRA
jgi:transcriptional regulator with XRE-family HTH domain